MLVQVLASDDFLSAVCSKFGNVHMLVQMCLVCKRTRDYLMRSAHGAKHWLRIAEAMGCDVIDIQNESIKERIQRVGKHICPWMFGVYNISPTFKIAGVAHHVSENHQWRCVEGVIHLRCDVTEKGGLERNISTDSSGILIPCDNPHKIVAVHREMREFDDDTYTLSPSMKKVHTLLGRTGFYSWDNDEFLASEKVLLFPIHSKTLMVVVLDDGEPCFHLFHVKSSKQGKSKRLCYLRTIYVGEMLVNKNPVIVWKQQIWIALHGGRFMVWGHHAQQTAATSPGHSLLFVLFISAES